MLLHLRLRRRCNLIHNLSFFTTHHNHSHQNRLISSCFLEPKQSFLTHVTDFTRIETPSFFRCYSFPSAVEQKPEKNNEGESESEAEAEGFEEKDEIEIVKLNVVDEERVLRDVTTVMNILHDFRTNLTDVKTKLDQCGVQVSSELVVRVLSRLNTDWEPSFTFFLWASEKKPDYSHSLREYHAMIYILGKARKFDTAWSLIDQMRRVGPSSIVTSHTLMIMIRRYCAVHNVGKAINTFYAYKKFGFHMGVEEFQNLLCALCRYKNVEDAESLLFCNRNVFPFNTKSFNIVLNGWSNVIASPRETERFWLKMSHNGMKRDVYSYANVISCYSKAGNLHKVLKLYDQMKEMNISPDKRVYNSVIYALAKAKHVKEALNLVKNMEEKGIKPNTVTYNSLIKPLCKAKRIDEAREVFDEMILQGHLPTVQTFHSFFRVLRTSEEVFTLLTKMGVMGCEPNIDTYIMLIRKFCRWSQLDNVFKVWNLMHEKGICYDRSSYIVLIHGLFLNGKLDEAHKYYVEMKEKRLIPEPKIDEKLLAWVSGRKIMNSEIIESKENMKGIKVISKPNMDELNQPWASSKQNMNSELRNPKEQQQEVFSNGKTIQENVFRREPETRRVRRERGFSFWE